MFAKLAVHHRHPFRRSLASQRSWTRTLHTFGSYSNNNNNHRDVPIISHSTAAIPPLANNIVISPNQQGLASAANVDVLVERVFQRAFPVPHAGSSDFVSGGEQSLEDDVLNTPPLQAIYYDPLASLNVEIQAMNRNARRPKKANKGARPCSRASRRKKKEKIGNRGR